MSAGIGHLAKDNKAKPSRVDSMDADRMNSIVERLSGVNPSKLAAEATGQKLQETAPVTAPMTAAAQGFDPYAQRAPQAQPDVQQLMQRMQMLEQKVAYYEQGKGDPAFSADHGPSNRGPESRVWRRDMDPKKAKKKDPVDGEPDGAKAQSGGQAMAGEHMNILGMSMTEWRDLAGLGAKPSINLTSGEVPQHILAESDEYEYEEFQEDYVTEDELAEAWFEFISEKGFDPGQFAQFAEDAEEMGDEVALLAIQDLEDEFQEAVESFLEAEKETLDDYLRRGGKITKGDTRKARGAVSLSSKYTRIKGKRDKSGHRLPANVKAESHELTQEEVEFMWDQWLESRGLTVEMFNLLIDEAIATEDEDEMDALLAVEDMFDRWLAEMSTFDVKKKMGSMAGKDATAWIKSLGQKKPEKAEDDELPALHVKSNPKFARGKPSASAAPARQLMPNRAPVKKSLPTRGGSQPEMSDKDRMSKLDKMLKRSGSTLRKEHFENLRRRLAEGTPVSKDDPIHKEFGQAKSIVGKLIKKTPTQGKEIKGFKSLVKKSRGGEDPRGWAKKWGLADAIEALEGMEFECDDDGSGNPKVDWEKLLSKSQKKLKRKGK